MLIHLGGTRILGMLVTMDGRQGADLLDLLQPRIAEPIHYDDYGVFRSPLTDFTRAAHARGLAGRVRLLARGEALMPLAPARPG